MKQKERTLLRNQRILLPLIVLAVLLFVLALSSAGSPVYAADASPQMLWPGEGGGGGNGPTPPENLIEGWIIQCNSYYGVSGIPVYINNGYSEFGPFTTDSNGYFVFSSYYEVKPDSWYSVEVNGKLSDLGNNAINVQWGQCRGMVKTDDNGYASVRLPLDSSTVVEVPAAAMYSNTKYAKLEYQTGTSNTFSHMLFFNVAGSGFSSGYSNIVTVSATFKSDPGLSYYVEEDHYAVTCWDNTVPGICTTGIGPRVLSAFWQAKLAIEYLQPTSLPNTNYVDIQVLRGIEEIIPYTEIGGRTWSVTKGISFGISYHAFGVQINLDTTAISTFGTINSVAIDIDRRGDSPSSPEYVTFRIYTPGAPLTIDPNNPTGGGFVGGIEVHVWDLSGAG